LGQTSLLIAHADFEAFWEAYPRKVGKGAARKAYGQAVKKTAPASILEAIPVYIANKPAWQSFAHPATWLNAERWNDEYGPPPGIPTKPELEQRLISVAGMVKRGLHSTKLSDHDVVNAMRAGLVTVDEAKAWGLSL